MDAHSINPETGKEWLHTIEKISTNPKTYIIKATGKHSQRERGVIEPKTIKTKTSYATHFGIHLESSGIYWHDTGDFPTITHARIWIDNFITKYPIQRILTTKIQSPHHLRKLGKTDAEIDKIHKQQS